MKPLDRLSEYLGAVERRLRLLALTRGAAVTAAAALPSRCWPCWWPTTSLLRPAA